MSSNTKNDQKLIDSLIAFNKQIIALKPSIKKVKVLECRRLIRKIKLLGQKKGNETQLEKNRRKCDNLKHEIQEIKKVKFIDVAIFSFDNEGLSFESYIKTKKPKKVDEIALARIALNKNVVQAIDKIKLDPKIDAWKRTFIVFKSRHEKRCSWKEKTKLLKELDTKFSQETTATTAADAIDEDEDEEEKSDEDDEDNEGEKKEMEKPKTTKPKPKPKPKPVLEETKSESYESDSDVELGDSESEAESDFNSAKNETGSEEEEEEEDEADEEDKDDGSESEQTDNSIVGEFTVPKPRESREASRANEPVATSLKPLVISNKPAYMEIRQINLEECQDLAELPIENKAVKEGDEERVDEGQDEEIERLKKKKLKNDAFFLDPNGNEIHSSMKFDPGLDQSGYGDGDYYNESRGGGGYGGYGGRDRRFGNSNFTDRRRDYGSASSSFKSSLGGSYNNNNNKSRQFSSDSNERWQNNNSSRTSSFSAFKTNRGATDFNNNNNDRGRGHPSRERFSSSSSSSWNAATTVGSKKPAVEEDLSKLHPSWQAKKNMQQKMTTLKFEGKKIKFD